MVKISISVDLNRWKKIMMYIPHHILTLEKDNLFQNLFILGLKSPTKCLNGVSHH